jgi:hypothetical protein
MPSILKATGRALSKAAGPLAFPLDFFLSLLDDERAEKKQKELGAALGSIQDLDEKAFSEIVCLRHEFKELRKQLRAGLGASSYYLMEPGTAAASPEALESGLFDFYTDNKSVYARYGFVTEEDLHNELCLLYRNTMPHFVRVIQFAGFPTEKLSPKAPPVDVMFEFLEECKKEDVPSRLKVFHALQRDCPGSHAIRTVVELHREIVAFDTLKSRNDP